MVTISSDEEDDGEEMGAMAQIGMPPVATSPAVAPTAVQSLMAAGKGLVASQAQGTSPTPVIQQQLQLPLNSTSLTRRQRMEDKVGVVI